MSLRLPRDLEATTQLSLGDRGSYEGKPFELVGRRCVQGPRGQIWNEWTVASEHDPPITLSESWGTFTMFREGSLLTMSSLSVGEPLPWLVVERGIAKRLAMYGRVEGAEEQYEYADLSFRGPPARRGSFVDGGTFIGDPVDPTSLGLSLRDAVPALIPAPNVSMPMGIQLWLALGDTGTLDGFVYRVLGIVARSSEAARWEEYLLYNARVGLRWLSVSEGHWSFGSPLEYGDAFEPSVEVTGRARLDWAAGELPWSATIGEVVGLSEYEELVIERNAGDVSAARIHELSPDDVARAFDKRSLPRPK